MGNLHKEQRAKGTGFWLRVIGYGVRVAGRMAHDSRPTQLRPTGRDMPRPYIPLPTLPIPHPTHHAYVFFSHPAQPAYRMAQGSWLTRPPLHSLLPVPHPTSHAPRTTHYPSPPHTPWQQPKEMLRQRRVRQDAYRQAVPRRRRKERKWREDRRHSPRR